MVLLKCCGGASTNCFLYIHRLAIAIVAGKQIRRVTIHISRYD